MNFSLFPFTVIAYGYPWVKAAFPGLLRNASCKLSGRVLTKTACDNGEPFGLSSPRRARSWGGVIVLQTGVIGIVTGKDTLERYARNGADREFTLKCA